MLPDNRVPRARVEAERTLFLPMPCCATVSRWCTILAVSLQLHVASHAFAPKASRIPPHDVYLWRWALTRLRLCPHKICRYPPLNLRQYAQQQATPTGPTWPVGYGTSRKYTHAHAGAPQRHHRQTMRKGNDAVCRAFVLM